MICLQNLLLPFMYLLTALIVKNNDILPGIYFIFLIKRPRPNLKVFQCHVFTSFKTSEKQSSSKTSFNNILRLTSFNFRFEPCQTPQNYQICLRNQVSMGLRRVRSKKLFAEINIEKIF